MFNWIKDIVDREKTRQEKNSYKNKWKATQMDIIKKDEEIIALQKQMIAQNNRTKETYHLVREVKAELKELRDYIVRKDYEDLRRDFEEIKEENEEGKDNVLDETKEN